MDMSMTLRLTEAQDRALTELAAVEGVSKREAVVRAIEDRAARIAQDRQVRELARAAIADHGPLLDRLAQ